MTRAERIARRKHRRWLAFWEKHWRPGPAFHTFRTMERLVGDDAKLKFDTQEVGMIESVRFYEPLLWRNGRWLIPTG